jgi:cell division protein FtsZ
MEYLDGANMAFITAGMGGGTGTGAAPVIARACRERGILTVGVVTKPFHFEGTLRMRMAEEGIAEMQQYVDTLIVIPNQNLFRVANEKTTFAEAFKMADSVLQSGVRGVTDLMVMPGLINLDFADIRSAMSEMGKAMMGTGEATGERRAIEAAESAINNPLLDDVSMKGARGVIINVTGGMDMTLFEVDEACNRIRDEVDPNANIIFGSTFDPSLDGVMRVSVVATGIEAEAVARVPGRTGRGPNGSPLRPDRSLPNAESVNRQPMTAAAPVAAAAHTAVAQHQVNPMASFAGAPTAAVSASAQPRSASQMAAKPEFVQQEAAVMQQHSVPVDTQVALAVDSNAPQATMYNEYFIPPKPVEAGQTTTASAASRVAGGLAATRPASQTAPGLNLRPPVQTQQAQKRRTPSLFERFTSPLWNNGEEQGATEEGRTETGSATGGSAGGSAGGLRASGRPTQGSLNIDATVSEGTESELDIPAFLRRQAN